MSLPGAYLQGLFELSDPSHQAAAGYKLRFTVAGSGLLTLKNTYSAADLLTANANPVILDSEGRPNTGTGSIFLAPGGYDVEVYDSTNALKYTRLGIQDVGLTYLQNLGVNLAAGGRGVTSGYTVLATDFLVTVNGTGGPNPCIINLPAASVRTGPLVIKNVGSVPLSIVPHGADAIDANAASAAYAIPAAAAPKFPSIMALPDGVSTFWITASHGVV